MQNKKITNLYKRNNLDNSNGRNMILTLYRGDNMCLFIKTAMYFSSFPKGLTWERKFIRFVVLKL